MLADVPDLSIVLLAYEEAARIGPTLDELAAFLDSRDYGRVEVVVVSAARPDGSRDETLAIAESKRPLFERLVIEDPGPKAGKGRDARHGMLAASGRYRIFMDADLATPLHHVDTALEMARNGSDVVIAVRDLSTSHTGLRKLISGLGNLLVQLLLLPGIRDTQCGFKLFTRQAAEDVFPRQTIDGWGFDMEVLAIARRLRHSIGVVPTPDWADVAGGSFHHVALSAAVETLWDLFVIRWRLLTRRYDQSRRGADLLGSRAEVVVGADAHPRPGVASRHRALPNAVDDEAEPGLSA
jgi:dolichyl-phosphate beta-glucosyltransferase